MPHRDEAAGEVVGGVLTIAGAVVTGHLLERAIAGPRPVVVGDLIGMPAGEGRAFGVVHSLRKGRRLDDHGVVEVHLLGEIAASLAAGAGSEPRAPVFRRGVSAFPALDAPIARATATETATVYAQPTAPHVRVGSLRGNPAIPAYALVDGLLGKHFAILGSTGSGKSCAVAVFLQALLDAYPHAHVVLIDPHGEYGPAFGERALQLDTSNLELPYWLMTADEAAGVLTSGDEARAYAEGAILRDAILRAKQAFLGSPDAAEAGRLTVDTPVPYRLSDLVRLIEEAMGNLNKPEAAAAYRHLLARIAAVRADRRYAFMFQSLLLRDSMEPILGRLLRLPVQGRPATILDVSGVPSEIVDVVVSLLCRLFFEFGLWSDRAYAVPVLLVCEEAHRYVPGDAAGGGFGPARRAIDRIAKEGRKYGVSLCLVTQRPSELSPGSLSQCGTIVALRMSNERDQAFVRDALPDGSDWLIRSLPALGTGEAVIVGEGVSVPMQVVLDRLPADRQPASHTPSFSRAWSAEADPACVGAAVARWRSQQR
jgi:DNA helicase HerA-like ATPase